MTKCKQPSASVLLVYTLQQK